jgi:hypothetical protein
MSCSDNYLCGYYKHFPSDDEKQPLVSCPLLHWTNKLISRYNSVLFNQEKAYYVNTESMYAVR